MERIIVTGGAGFIGSALCRYLVAETDAFVLNVDKLTYAANLASLEPVAKSRRYGFMRADIGDRDMMARIIDRFRPTAIMNLAAESHVDRSITGSDVFIETNIVGSYRLMEVARAYFEQLTGPERDVFRFLQVSTDEVYGSLGAEGLFEEGTPYAPSSPYSASKASADHLALAAYRTYGFPIVISNCSNNYGPYHFPEKLIPLIILKGLHGEPLPIYGDGSNVRDWLYVDDHARALHLVMSKGRLGEKYNVGGGNERTNLEVVTGICRLLDATRPKATPHAEQIEFVADRPGHDARYAIDASKITAELGWKAQESFETGLAKTVHWYLRNEGWWRPMLQKTYAGERLGLPGAHETKVADSAA